MIALELVSNFHSKTYLYWTVKSAHAHDQCVGSHLCARKNKREVVNIRIACVSTIGMAYYVYMCDVRVCDAYAG